MFFNLLYSIIIYPIVFVIEFVFVFSLDVFKQTGIAIVCVSAAISVLCLPLYMIAEKWQEVERDIQRRFAPKIAKIKAVFKGDEQYMITSTFYKQNKYHPIYALRGTFGLLFQIPFFIAAYSYLSHLELLNGASFLFINDLSKPDAIIPIAGGINLLPVLMTLINCTSGFIYTRNLAAKDKIQVYGIALVFLFLLYNSPSGLVFYWTLNNVFSFLKNIYLNIKLKNKNYILYIIISAAALIFSYYSLFILINNINVKALISVIFLIIGLFPWAVPYIFKLLKKIKIAFWTKKETFLLFIISIIIIWASIGVFTPSMLISSSPQEFSYIDSVSSPLFFILNSSIQAFGLFIFWPLIIFFLMSDKIKNVFSIIAAILSISVLCNFFIFPGNYGLISNSLVFTGNPYHNIKEIFINLSVLSLFIIFISFIYFIRRKKLLSILYISMLSAIILYSISNLNNIYTEYKKLSEYYRPLKNEANTINQIINLSKTEKNVLIIMLDMAVSVFIPYIFEENPELSKKYEGFTYYPNTVTFNGWTSGGAPPIFGGYEYTPEGINERSDISIREKNNESLLLLPLLFSSEGFSVTITDPPYANNNWIPDLRIFDKNQSINSYITDGMYTDLWLKQNNIKLFSQSDVLKRNILWYSIFRAAPLAFRQGLYYKGSWCAPISDNWMRKFLDGYAVLDYLSELTKISDTAGNTAFIMTNNTAHESLFLQAPEYKPQRIVNNYGTSRFKKEIWYHVNAAAIHRLAGYFDFLKQQEVYDNTRIILVSDHGRLDSTYVTKTSLPFHIDHFNPILFFKDFNENGEMKTDMSFMSTADVPSLAVKNIIKNPVNPFTENEITQERKNNPLLILIDRVESKNKNEIRLDSSNTYYVHDNIFNEKNWSRPEKLP